MHHAEDSSAGRAPRHASTRWKAPERGGAPKLEVGVLAAAAVPAALIDQAVDTLARELRHSFPHFDWFFARQRWTPREVAGNNQPSALLTEAAEGRDAAHWDFVLLVTDSDLAGHVISRPFAALSRALDAAAISLARLRGLEAPGERTAERLATLLRHALAHIAGLDEHEDAGNLLYRPTRAADLDSMHALEDAQIERWRLHLEEIADERLEETPQARHAVRFLASAIWINRFEIAQAIVGARPWQLPYRLGRLTAAAVSALAILMMTAEAWDVGLSLGAGRIATLTCVSLAATTLYVTVRQRLLPRRAVASTEQTVVTAVASVSIVLFGMLAAWTMLAIMALLASSLLFPEPVVAGWASAALEPDAPVGALTWLRMAFFSASLATIIGALGASFEDQYYFRHVVLVDEEI